MQFDVICICGFRFLGVASYLEFVNASPGQHLVCGRISPSKALSNLDNSRLDLGQDKHAGKMTCKLSASSSTKQYPKVGAITKVRLKNMESHKVNGRLRSFFHIRMVLALPRRTMPSPHQALPSHVIFKTGVDNATTPKPSIHFVAKTGQAFLNSTGSI